MANYLLTQSGDEVQAILDAVQSGYLFRGVADPGVNPGAPDVNVCYLAGPGAYTYYGGLVVPDKSLGILKYDGSWALETISAEDIAEYVQVTEDGWHLVDEQLNIALKYDADGLDAAKVSDHFKSLIVGGVAFVQVVEDGLYFVDEQMNIGAKLTTDGFFAKNLMSYEII